MSADPLPAWPADAIEVGRIGAAWGVRGEFTVQPYSESPEALVAAPIWHLRPRADDSVGSKSAQAWPAALEIGRVRPHGGALVASAPSVVDRDQAEALRGARIFVARSSFPKVGDDEYYWADLIGLAVVNRADVALGVVADLIDNGAQSVLRVRAEGDEGGVEHLIPFVDAYVDAIDLPARHIVVDWQPDY